MKTIKVQFSRKTTYEAYIKADDLTAEQILELENDEVEMYLPSTDKKKLKPNPIYELLNDAATEQNVFEDEDRFEDVCGVPN